jgi:hypothetical protein
MELFWKKLKKQDEKVLAEASDLAARKLEQYFADRRNLLVRQIRQKSRCLRDCAGGESKFNPQGGLSVHISHPFENREGVGLRAIIYLFVHLSVVQVNGTNSLFPDFQIPRRAG